MTGFELLTAKRLGLNPKIVIFNDNSMGLIKSLQKTLYVKTSTVDFTNPDFAKLADSFGADYFSIKNDYEIDDKLMQIVILKIDKRSKIYE